MKLALKITPQRNTQYANMAHVLAIPELLASPLGKAIAGIEPARLAGQEYLLVEIKSEWAEAELLAELAVVLPRLGAISEGYEYFAQLAGLDGPLLRPIEPRFTPFVPLEMAEVRRYKGKTNELFTQVLLNLAIFAGAYREQFTEHLRVLDPLAGGGTTLFLALAAGYDAFGIEQNRHDVETTEVFIRQYFHSEHVLYKELDERGRKAGRRYQFAVGPKKEPRYLVLVHGETAQAVQHMQEVPGGPRVHALVGDLPYGIQHFGEIEGLLKEALPVWERLLLPGGVLALAWNATRIERAELQQLIAASTKLRMLTEAPYAQLEHTVDRVIKKRDVLIAVKAE
ncbi:MAG TPA: hypothetical protein VGD98_11830 [Ktedonobacteraceae bacterium]